MPYKILDPAGISVKTTLEDEFNFLESEGFDFISSLDRFAIFHKPLEKPKRTYNKKTVELKGGTPAISSQQAKGGNGSKGTLYLSSPK